MTVLRVTTISIFIAVLALSPRGNLLAESRDMSESTTELPEKLGEWVLAGAPKRIDSETIFDYMNGAGELYLAYHFDHLTVAEYRDKGDNSILVEVYRMKDPSDAFGLLSMDWDGESVALQSKPAGFHEADFPHALYGKGLLRLRSGNIYARVLAVREASGVREIILRIGGILASTAGNQAPPDLVRALPESVAGGWRLDRMRIGYFYSHLVLNSHHYISHDNILDLDSDCEAVIAPYFRRSARSGTRIRLLVVRYAWARRARKAADGFATTYLPDLTKHNEPLVGIDKPGVWKVEDGWLGWRLSGRVLVLAFGCPDSACVEKILDRPLLDRFQDEGGEYEK